MQNLSIAFINPPHADWSLANNMTYLQCQSHYEKAGKYKERVNWIKAPYKWDQYETLEEVYSEVSSADIILFSSYTWNADLIDQFAHYVKKHSPKTLRVIGGPHIGTNEPDLLKRRKDLYDYICRPTKPGEVFVEDLINDWFENNSSPRNKYISWEISSDKKTSFSIEQNYSVYEEHNHYLSETLDYAKNKNIEPFIVLETTRGCPYKCVYCEWGGGTGTKILKKSIDIVKRDIKALKKAGFRDAYLTDANFGAFKDRDLEIFKYAWESKLNLTDISTVKTPILEKRIDLINSCFKIIGKNSNRKLETKNEMDMWGETENVSLVPTVSIQSISKTAMKISNRVDLNSQDKLKLSHHINKMCTKEGYTIPAIELILAMPGSTIDDFYEEMNIIWNFQAWSSFRHDYMFLPDSELNSPSYLEKYQIETVEVFSDIVDEDGIDNWNSLYRGKKNHFKTIKSCYSFTHEEMVEMWFMNNASNYLLQNIYPLFTDYLTPPVFAKRCFNIISNLSEFKIIFDEIYDIYDSSTPPKSIRKLQGQFRVKTIEAFLVKNKKIIINEIMLKTYRFENEISH